MATLFSLILFVSALAIFVFLMLKWLFTTPDSTHPLWGNLLEVYDDKLTDIYTKWSHTFGGVYRLWGPFGVLLIFPRFLAGDANLQYSVEADRCHGPTRCSPHISQRNVQQVECPKILHPLIGELTLLYFHNTLLTARSAWSWNAHH